MLLELKNIEKRFSTPQGQVTAVDGVDLIVRTGENVSVVGESGCGKTTLAKIIMGLLSADKGSVLWDGKDAGKSAESFREFRRKVRMVFQNPFDSLDPRFTVRAILAEALVLEPGMKSSEAEKRMKKLLKAVGLPQNILGRYPHEFSGGERQRIAIARALMTEPSLLILDEAVSSLDVIVQKRILDMLEELQGQMDVTYLFISHNLRAVRKISRKIAVMWQGKIVEYGSVKDVFHDARHPYTQRLLTAALRYKADDSPLTDPSKGQELRDVGRGHLVLLS